MRQLVVAGFFLAAGLLPTVCSAAAARAFASSGRMVLTAFGPIDAGWGSFLTPQVVAGSGIFGEFHEKQAARLAETQLDEWIKIVAPMAVALKDEDLNLGEPTFILAIHHRAISNLAEQGADRLLETTREDQLWNQDQLNSLRRELQYLLPYGGLIRNAESYGGMASRVSGIDALQSRIARMSEKLEGDPIAHAIADRAAVQQIALIRRAMRGFNDSARIEEAGREISNRIADLRPGSVARRNAIRAYFALGEHAQYLSISQNEKSAAATEMASLAHEAAVAGDLQARHLFMHAALDNHLLARDPKNYFQMAWPYVVGLANRMPPDDATIPFKNEARALLLRERRAGTRPMELAEMIRETDTENYSPPQLKRQSAVNDFIVRTTLLRRMHASITGLTALSSVGLLTSFPIESPLLLAAAMGAFVLFAGWCVELLRLQIAAYKSPFYRQEENYFGAPLQAEIGPAPSLRSRGFSAGSDQVSEPILP